MAFLVSKDTAWKMQAYYAGRYSYMLASSDPVDRANAEAHRLGARAWQRIAREAFQQYDDLGQQIDSGDTFNEEEVIREAVEHWNRYLRTGEQEDERQAIAKELMASMTESIAKRYPIAPIARPQDESADSDKKKKSQAKPEPKKVMSSVDLENARQKAELERLRLEKIKENLEYTIPRAIDEIVNVIRTSFNVSRQSEEIETSIVDTPHLSTSHAPVGIKEI